MPRSLSHPILYILMGMQLGGLFTLTWGRPILIAILVISAVFTIYVIVANRSR